MKRLPIIRHVRYFLYLLRVERHYAMWNSLGRWPAYRGEDDIILDAIWRGER